MIARTHGDDDAVAAAAARAFNEVVDPALRGARMAGRKIPQDFHHATIQLALEHYFRHLGGRAGIAIDCHPLHEFLYLRAIWRS